MATCRDPKAAGDVAHRLRDMVQGFFAVAAKCISDDNTVHEEEYFHASVWKTFEGVL